MSGKYIFSLCEETRKYCEENLNESEKNREKCLEEVKKWAAENAQLNAKVDDRSILPFLRCCKFNVERTKTKMQNYYTLRRDAPEWFRNRNPLLSEIQDLVRLGVFIPLRKKFNKQLVVVIRTAAHDPGIHKQDDVFKTGKMLLDVASLEDELAQIYGVVAIFDMKGVGLAHARQLTPSMIKKAVFAWQNYHCRPQRLDFINAPIYINVVLSVFKRFMSEKLKSRVSVHYGNPLINILPKDILPKDYGGEDENLEDILKYWQEKLFQYRDWFEEDEKHKAV